MSASAAKTPFFVGCQYNTFAAVKKEAHPKKCVSLTIGALNFGALLRGLQPCRPELQVLLGNVAAKALALIHANIRAHERTDARRGLSHPAAAGGAERND